MISKESVQAYSGPALMRGPGYVYLRPSPLLAPYIANYTVTCPVVSAMSEQYTVMPTASTTLVYSVGENAIFDGLRGVNTKAAVVGGHAAQYRLLLLIEFHPAGLYPLLGLPQSELLDVSFPFSSIDKGLHERVLGALLASQGIAALKDSLDHIFLAELGSAEIHPQVALAIRHIFASAGGISPRALSAETFYSEKQLQRLFKQHVGTGMKTFSRIVRMQHAMRLLERADGSIASIAAAAGYFDQPHLIHDFQLLCGISPQAYLEKKSIFYNDRFKM